jgi:hypothetical protein
MLWIDDGELRGTIRQREERDKHIVEGARTPVIYLGGLDIKTSILSSPSFHFSSSDFVSGGKVYV